jgi:dephospho-CoA kinase
MRVIGLTGGVATGKSTVARLLRERGVPIVDADVAARAVVEPGTPTLARIAERFGPEVITADGALDRAAMRARIIADPEERRALEAITHPAILAHMTATLGELAKAGHPIAVVEAALMVETGTYRSYDGLIVVSCDAQTQLARLMSRDAQSAAAARGLIEAQLPLAAKEAVADEVIHNDADLAALREATERAWARISTGRTGRPARP